MGKESEQLELPIVDVRRPPSRNEGERISEDGGNLPVGAALRYIRRKRRIKLVDFAARLGTDWRRVRNVEMSMHGTPRIAKVCEYAAVLGVPPSRVYEIAEHLDFRYDPRWKLARMGERTWMAEYFPNKS